MSILDKAMFWKKKDDFNTFDSISPLGDKSPGLNGPSPGVADTGFQSVHGLEHHDVPLGAPMPLSPNDPTSTFAANNVYHDASISNPPMQQIPEQNIPSENHSLSSVKQYSHHDMISKELEIISTKLDFLKASLESINQRLANLENASRQDKW